MRTTRAGRTAVARTAPVAAALTVALALASGSAVASAQTRVASIGADGSSQESDVDGAGLAQALGGLADAANAVLNDGVQPAIEDTADGLNIVLDPSAIAGLAEALLPKAPAGQLSTSMRGVTASGAQVVFPTTGTYTSGYGMRWGSMHNGIDIANSIGTPVVAVMDGTVINSGPAQGYGYWIRIQHDDGSISVYGHMPANTLAVSVGQRVTAGQQIAGIGNEGRSTGPHLHFEIWPDGSNPVDPQQWFAQQGIRF